MVFDETGNDTYGFGFSGRKLRNQHFTNKEIQELKEDGRVGMEWLLNLQSEMYQNFVVEGEAKSDNAPTQTSSNK